MISNADLISLVKTKIPDAEVNVLDKTGMRDHFIVHVTSRQFASLSLMDRHRLVQASLADAMKDGRVHAAEIKTAVPTGA
jgi:stress-induced morphogen